LFFKIKKGLDIPLQGRPDERIDAANEVSSVAVLGSDYVGLKPTMLVREGDVVKEGTPLFEGLIRFLSMQWIQTLLQLSRQLLSMNVLAISLWVSVF